jgi:hypothetical protein
MKKILLALCLALPTPALAEPIAYPGFAWVNVVGPHVGGEEDGNWVITGRVQQGADWVDIDGWRLQTFVAVTASTDTKKFEWNDRLIPAIGASIRKDTKIGQFEIGTQLVHESRFGRRQVGVGRETTGIQVFANYWAGWGR